ncbi:uncharacterized protein CMU_015050 [Cryptosporidium muris RN66]|uniref:Uncharacterized protein n=1 Tax=Cryptosporidium muris (strain RN66) TaxID=441375 RepID=B6AF62_CRYMR|nr:uncharacterized protein CMU_015050 [Cryptosporidium muris RN66]EEA06829.1 hypothetical protein, conserved [Cryptosporidium muris RN66]|eukprot:XP_002141178.1 hypothetical protein [Cryptosporidium muris RN66]
MECLICYSNLDDSNSVEYQVYENSSWYLSKYCESIKNTKCLKEQRALLQRGPPVRYLIFIIDYSINLIIFCYINQINVRDIHGFPECHDNEVFSLCNSKTRDNIDPKLDGSLIGDERIKFWNELKQFISKEDMPEEISNESN